LDNLELDKVVDTSSAEVVAFAEGASLARNKIVVTLDSQRDSLVVDRVVDTLKVRRPWSVGIPWGTLELGRVVGTSVEQPSWKVASS